ncbi:MAG: MAPEG family protein [Proteobacteria bacterium]|nr:MAPEG family protein [Pseudomonadota bacterium]
MDLTVAAGAAQALAISSSYIALFILLGVALSIRVVMLRRQLKIGLGDGGDKNLGRAIRVHGNFSEYAPLLLAILVLLPFLGAKEWLVHLIGLSGLVGRVLHAVGVTGSAGASPGRITGMMLNYFSLATGALSLLVLAWR